MPKKDIVNHSVASAKLFRDKNYDQRSEMPQNKPFNDGVAGYGTAATRENTHTCATDMQALTNNTSLQLQSETTNIIRDESHNESTHNRSIAAQNISREERNQID